MPSNDGFAIRLEGVSKRYLLNPNRPWKLQEFLTNPRSVIGRIRSREAFWALNDVSLEVEPGEIVGIIGLNGSGKSTLLRTMVGISPPTSGSVKVNGRYAALLELGAGFHTKATGRENAYVNALFMGLNKQTVKEVLPEIIEFSGLGKFIDQPMRTYSSGMFLRLGFSVAVHVKPEILLIDEILAVGDIDFQQKCFDHFATLKQRGATIILVTHNMATLREFADRVIQMEQGRVVNDGQPNAVIDEYIANRLKASPAARKIFREALKAQGLLPEEAAGEEATPDGVER